MPAHQIENYLNGTAKFEDINKQDWDDYVAEQQKMQKDLVNQSRSASSTMSALRVRPVMAQAQASKAANKSSAVPTKPGPPPTFSATDSSALNKMRFVYSGSPYTAITNYGPNSYIPDANLYMMIANECDRLLVTTRKFTEIAEFWTPLHSKYYDSVIFIVCAMRAAAATRAVSDEIRDVLDLFEGQNASYPSASVPILGPLANTLASLASSLPHIVDVDPIAPWLPDSPNATATNYFNFNNNCSMRLPPVPLFLHQLGWIHNLTDPADTGNLTNARWNGLFLNDVFGFGARRANNATPPVAIDSSNYREHYQLNATTPVHVARQINGPGVLPCFISSNSITNFNNYRASVFPPEFSRTNSVPAATLTWIQFLGLNDPYFFQSVLRVMCIRAKFFKGSVNLSDIAPSGHTGGQIVGTVVAKGSAVTRTSHRYRPQNWTFNLNVYNPLSPESDMYDAAIAPINLSQLPAGTNGHNVDANADVGSSSNMATHRLGGYFFTSLPRMSRATAQNPTNGYGTVITTHFYSPVPLRD